MIVQDRILLAVSVLGHAARCNKLLHLLISGPRRAAKGCRLPVHGHTHSNAPRGHWWPARGMRAWRNPTAPASAA